ncbi:MAG: CBS domain-containing protein, partial [Chloroflexota bacterium]|nr:CBS domain-containing protein [Chloroflexota bacterium]
MNELESEPGPLPHPARLEAVMGPVVLVREDTPLRDVATLMLESHVDCMVVVDAAGVARGIVTDRQLTLDERWLRLSAVKVPHLHGRSVKRCDELEAACLAAETTTAAEVMDRRLTTAEVLEPISTVVDRMLRRDAECALVLRTVSVIGLLGRRDLLRLVAAQPKAQPVGVGRTRHTPSARSSSCPATWRDCLA